MPAFWCCKAYPNKPATETGCGIIWGCLIVVAKPIPINLQLKRFDRPLLRLFLWGCKAYPNKPATETLPVACMTMITRGCKAYPNKPATETTFLLSLSFTRPSCKAYPNKPATETCLVGMCLYYDLVAKPIPINPQLKPMCAR